MIRRNDGQDWLLISQVDHAHLAAEIASVWGNEVVPPIPLPELLVPAIRDHDDGWYAWEQAPTADPKTGWPRDFTEMPMSTATDIWSRSILNCSLSDPVQQPSSLAGIWTSRHFCWLAEKALSSRQENDEERLALTAFLQQQACLQREWRQELSGSFDAGRIDSISQSGFRCLQFFDRVSLWMCCSAEVDALQAASTDEQMFRFTGLASRKVLVDPYPLSVESLKLSVAARRIGAAAYKDDAQLRAALAQAPLENIEWVLAG